MNYQDFKSQPMTMSEILDIIKREEPTIKAKMEQESFPKDVIEEFTKLVSDNLSISESFALATSVTNTGGSADVVLNDFINDTNSVQELPENFDVCSYLNFIVSEFDDEFANLLKKEEELTLRVNEIIKDKPLQGVYGLEDDYADIQSLTDEERQVFIERAEVILRLKSRDEYVELGYSFMPTVELKDYDFTGSVVTTCNESEGNVFDVPVSIIFAYNDKMGNPIKSVHYFTFKN